MNNSAWNMYVFRDGRRSVPGQRLVSALSSALQAMRSPESHSRSFDELAVTALVAAGELECALADSGSSFTSAAERLTETVADLLLRPSQNIGPALLQAVEAIHAPAEVRIAVHEGFAYYALHPLKFSRLAEQVNTGARAAVIGLRSIGAPLCAVVSASLRHRGIESPRITVRPTGHPYDRRLSLSSQLREFIDVNREATFLVVDEGPGLSGSSFLSVAEALEEGGIPSSQIVLLGSRQPDPAQLRAPRAAERWPRFRFLCAESAPVMPEGAAIPLAGGEWRNHFASPGESPACWPQLEMAKFLSADRTQLYKFEGFGHFGEEIANRARLLADYGVGAPHHENQQGFGRYAVLSGRLLRASDISSELLGAAANYCALRASVFASDNAETSAVGDMLRWNLQCEFGAELAPSQSQLILERPAIVDGRMLPHEWMEVGRTKFVKLDATSHGDDHFLPGPCDIAWDLAGFIVEWDLDKNGAELFLETYRQQSGDRPESRLRPYRLAYTAFRLGWSRMAAQACAGQPDEALLHRDCLRYRKQAEALLAELRINKPMLSPPEPAAA